MIAKLRGSRLDGCFRGWFRSCACLGVVLVASSCGLYEVQLPPLQKPAMPGVAAEPTAPEKTVSSSNTEPRREPSGNTIACDKLHPRIQQIGDDSILTFEGPATAPDAAGARRELIIPVEGRDLFNDCIAMGIFVSGTVPAQKDRDWEIVKPRPQGDVLGVKLTSFYLDRVKSGDRIAIHVLISDTPERRLVSNKSFRHYIVRRFTLYETQYYRDKVLANQVPLHEVEAFPLPEEEAEALFGQAVSNNFFAVRLTVTNTRDFDKLINTGLIVARGRALVEPLEETLDPPETARVLRYTIPVAVTPQSDKQMFTVLDDRQPFTTRNWVFRGLDFAGALATATVAAFSGSKDLAQGVGLLTGTVTPGLREVFPDRYTAYKRNMVAYAMPELIKIPRRASVGHRYLFFSKNKIQGLILNQELYGRFESVSQPADPEAYEPLLRSTEIPKPPKVALVSLQFDHLEISFERVVGNLEMSVRDRVAAVEMEIQRKWIEIERLQENWLSVDKNNDGKTDPGRESTEFLAGMTHPHLLAVAKNAKAAVDLLQPLATDAARRKAAKDYQDALREKADLEKASPRDETKIAAAKKKLEALEKDGRRAGAIIKASEAALYLADAVAALTPGRIKLDLLDNKTYGLAAVKGFKTSIQEISTAIVGGRDPDLLDTQVKAIEGKISLLGQALRFYLEAASRIKEGLLFKVSGTEKDVGDLPVATLEIDVLEKLAKDMAATTKQLQEFATGLPIEIGKQATTK